MKLAVILLSLLTCSAAFARPSVGLRERINFDAGWLFTRGDAPGTSLDWKTESEWALPTGDEFLKDPTKHHKLPPGDLGSDLPYTKPEYDDSGWAKVDLPHDWGIAGPFSREGGGGTGRLPFAGVGWYRKTFVSPATDIGLPQFLEFDGTMSYALVWLNGHFLGGWPYGYASWRVPVWRYMKPGARNVIAVRLDNPANASRWYPGGGIYRHVWLETTSPLYVVPWGVAVTTPSASKDRAAVDVSTTIQNVMRAGTVVSLRSEVYALDTNGRRTGDAVAAIVSGVPIEGRSSATVQQELTVQNPRLWGPPPTQKPSRYVLVSKIKQPSGMFTQEYETPFGIRSIKFTPNDGFQINGQRVDFRGVCDHHDLGALGAALNETALHRQIDMLIEMGCNAIRTSHNPPAPELLDYCDRKGILVMDEYADIWQAQKTPEDYHRVFDDWHEQDLRAMIQRDRNHPSVVMWSVGNEVGEQFRGENGAKVARMLTEIAHDADPTRPTTTAMNAARADGPFPSGVDLIGLNYQGTGVRNGPPQYPVFHAKYPDKFIYGSETTATVSTRGEYYFPVAPGFGVPASTKAGEDPTRHQVSSYDLYSASWSYSPDKEFWSQERWPYVGGEFVWTGWDYLGEPTPFDSSRSSYFGIIDLAGFKKDRFYLYQAHWRPDFPMAHILPHWTWPDRVGQVTPVRVYTSGDEGELFFNGKSLGRKKKGQCEYRLRWDDVVYQPGTLKVATYKNGKPWATDEVRTAGPSSRLRLQADRRSIADGGRDLVFVTVSVQDDRGRLVPQAHPHIAFSVEGPGELVATDNGDPTDFEPFPSHDRDAFNGLALVIVKAKPGQSGRIQITATSDGLKSATAEVGSR